MSIRMWIREFMPRTASAVAKDGVLAALVCAEKKYIGLFPGNLEKHDVRFVGPTRELIDGEGGGFLLTSDTCALCDLFLYTQTAKCPECPLYTIRGVRCDQPDKEAGSKDTSPYQLAIHGRPAMMLALIRKGIEIEEENGTGREIQN